MLARPGRRLPCFNPRSRKGNDDNGQLADGPYLGFNPRSRKGNDKRSESDGSPLDVSIHVPARGTTFTRSQETGIQMFQSTFPQGERPILNKQEIINFKVSIHVPARGTTVYEVTRDRYTNVSIHVPARGTTVYEVTRDRYTNVSIHVPARGTTSSVNEEINLPEVSIHVPARGTTGTGRYPIWGYQVSIHVPARGTTICMYYIARKDQVSIHVPARGTTMMPVHSIPGLDSFNPRSRKGNDATVDGYNALDVQFQSTFPQGERRFTRSQETAIPVFQSTFPQGERLFPNHVVQILS